MAGDWIKMRVGLGYDLKVMQLARLLNGDSSFLNALVPDEPLERGSCNASLLHTFAVGALHKFWCIAQEVTDDGTLGSTDTGDIDCLVGIPGFADAMIAVGWLEVTEDGCLQIHNWQEHNGDSSKKRASTKKRVDKHRDLKRDGVTTCNAQALPEKRREEKRISTEEKEKKETQSGDCSPSLPNEDQLNSLLDSWNELPKSIAPQVSNHRSESIITGWKKVQRTPELKAAFADIPHLMAKIRDGTFLHGNGWFKFSWLFGKKNSEWNVLKILDGNYERNENGVRRHDPARVESQSTGHSLFD